MQTHMQLQKQLKEKMLLNLGETLKILSDIFLKDTSTSHDISVVHANHARFEREVRLGKMRHEDERIEFAKFSDSVLSFIQQITEEVAADYDLRNSIFSKILVICRSEARVTVMKKIFSASYYKKITYDISQQPLPLEEIKDYDLLIYDNDPFLDDSHPHELLRHYLALTPHKPYILYSGQTLKLLYQYPEKAYFSNSIFSIHARIQEMMSFIKYYQAESPA